MDKAEGRVKEAYGALIGDEEKAEGRAQQRKAKAEEEAEQREKARQAEAEAAEKERDRQRLKDKGIVGDLTDNLTGR
jgi:uncharacterized protein YjbJ (UPF0337 family)